MDTPLKHGGNHVAQTLLQHDVKYVFTLCGGHISPILTGCNTLRIKVIDVRNEATAVFAADAVSRLSSGIGVERTFQTHSPMIDSIKVKRKGDVRQAKLFYLRERSGKSARIKERLE